MLPSGDSEILGRANYDPLAPQTKRRRIGLLGTAGHRIFHKVGNAVIARISPIGGRFGIFGRVKMIPSPLVARTEDPLNFQGCILQYVGERNGQNTACTGDIGYGA